MNRSVEDPDERDTSWQRFVLCEEERIARTGNSPGSIGFRWFRSPNIVPIEQIRRDRFLRRYDR
jgi:hypothetical protein